jgi:hypothetical protein
MALGITNKNEDPNVPRFSARLAARPRADWYLEFALALLLILCALPRTAAALPSFASQTGMPCSQCHTLSYGPALTAYGRQFKLNGYTFGKGERPMPLAAMIQGGYSHSDTAQPAPPVDDFHANDNLSVDQVSLFLGTRLTEHIGMFAQATYSGEDRHFSWDNTDIRYAQPLTLFGTDAVIGISVNNNPTVQDLWNSTPAWAYPFITSPLLPGVNASPIVNGGLAQLVLGATAYTMIHEHLYLEAGAYRGISDRWLNNVGLYPSSSAHVNGAAPYWRAAYQFTRGANNEHYFSVGTFGLDVKLQPDPTVPDTNRYTDVAFDATYQYTPEAPYSLNVNASLIHEKQDLSATFNAAGADSASNHLNALEIDASFVYQQTWSAGLGLFDTSGGTDLTLYGQAPFSGSNNGSPDTRGYTLQLEYVPFGKADSWGRPWVNVRLGLQYTGYLRFNGGSSNYDGAGRSASQNNSLFLFYWMAF